MRKWTKVLRWKSRRALICFFPRVERLFQLAGAIERRVATSRSRAEHLTQAVLAKAFRGELVPTEADLARREGREYESASELLRRITAERESGESLIGNSVRRRENRQPNAKSHRRKSD